MTDVSPSILDVDAGDVRLHAVVDGDGSALLLREAGRRPGSDGGT